MDGQISDCGDSDDIIMERSLIRNIKEELVDEYAEPNEKNDQNENELPQHTSGPTIEPSNKSEGFEEVTILATNTVIFSTNFKLKTNCDTWPAEN